MSALVEAERVHLELLEKWRGAMNLIGPGPAEDHIIDARAAVVSLDPRGRWADLGSGAGFPGLALAIHHPALEVLLVESRERRVGFLKQVVRAAGLVNVEVFHGRTETLSGPFDGVISRGYRPLIDYLGDADRLLHERGSAVAMTGAGPLIDVPDDWTVHGTWTYEVPNGRRSVHELRRA